LPDSPGGLAAIYLSSHKKEARLRGPLATG
jgi:hypothetical protein